MKKSELLFALGDLVEKQAEIIADLSNEISALKSIIGELETKAQSSEQMEITLQAQINGLREHCECLDIQNQTLATIVEKRFTKIAEAATGRLNLITNNLEAR